MNVTAILQKISDFGRVASRFVYYTSHHRFNVIFSAAWFFGQMGR
jgi:hypothetical protein